MPYVNTSPPLFALILVCGVFSACILLPEQANPCDENQQFFNPACSPQCASWEIPSAPCQSIGQSCIRPVDDCVFKGVCTTARKWSGTVICEGDIPIPPDAGTTDAEIVDADPGHCGSCADAITNGTDNVCDASKPYYDAFIDCTCNRGNQDPMPGCKDDCGDHFCTGGTPSADCSQCVTVGACATEFGVCAGDF